MNTSEFDKAMAPFYREFYRYPETPQERADRYTDHFRTLSDLPAEAVEAAVAQVLSTWTEPKAVPRIGMVRSIALNWIDARTKRTKVAPAIAGPCDFCKAKVGTVKGSDSPRLEVQHEPSCPRYVRGLEVVELEPVADDWRSILRSAIDKHGTHR